MELSGKLQAWELQWGRSSQWTEYWVSLRAGLDTEAKRRIICSHMGAHPTVQSVARYYTHWASPTLQMQVQKKFRISSIFFTFSSKNFLWTSHVPSGDKKTVDHSAKFTSCSTSTLSAMCAYNEAGSCGCLVPRKKAAERQTDRQGRAHLTARRKPKKTPVHATLDLILKIFVGI